MKNKVVFSILIPAYKAKFFRQAIESVLSQTYKDLELIIVDDASPEDLKSIVAEFNDSRIHYYRNEVGFGAVNVVGNWNKCLEYASGDYVICMGDDDELSEKCLEEYAKLIENHPVLDCYHTRMAYIDETSSIIDLQIDRAETDTVYSLIWHTWKGRGAVLGDWLFSFSFLKQNGGFVNFPCAWSSDTITVFMAASDKGVANSPYIGFKYRVSQYTISSKNNKLFLFPKLQSWCEVEKWYSQFLKPIPDNDLDLYYRNYLLKSLKDEMLLRKRLEIRKCFCCDKKAFIGIFCHSKKYGINKFSVVKEFLLSFHLLRLINKML